MSATKCVADRFVRVLYGKSISPSHKYLVVAYLRIIPLGGRPCSPLWVHDGYFGIAPLMASEALLAAS